MNQWLGRNILWLDRVTGKSYITEVINMASAEEVKLDQVLEKIDSLLYYTRNEVNIHPDTIRPGMQFITLGNLSGHSGATISGHIEVFDRDGFRWMRLYLKDVMGTPVFSREWQCIYRDPYNGTVISRPA